MKGSREKNAGQTEICMPVNLLKPDPHKLQLAET